MSGSRSVASSGWGARVLMFAAAAAMATTCLAQDVRPALTSDSAFQRAQRLANDGDLASARAIADSALNASTEGSATYVEALFRRATFAASTDAARRDYLRIALEYALAPRAEDALLRLAQIEIARGDRATAKRHLERLVLEHADGKLRAHGEYWLGRVLLEEGALPQACAALGEARARLLPVDLELGNQISYHLRQCELASKVEEPHITPDSAAKVEASPKGDNAAGIEGVANRQPTAHTIRGRAVTNSATRGPAWSAQIEAYGARTEADRLARKLVARGFDTRVTTDSPFRVRIGRFARRQEAVALAAKLRSLKMMAIVVEAERP